MTNPGGEEVSGLRYDEDFEGIQLQEQLRAKIDAQRHPLLSMNSSVMLNNETISPRLFPPHPPSPPITEKNEKGGGRSDGKIRTPSR